MGRGHPSFWEKNVEPMSHFSHGANPRLCVQVLGKKGLQEDTQERAQPAVSESRKQRVVQNAGSGCSLCLCVEHTRALGSEAPWGQRTALLCDTSSCVLEMRSTSGSSTGAWAAKRCHSSAQLLRKSVGGAWQGDVDCSSISHLSLTGDPAAMVTHRPQVDSQAVDSEERAGGEHMDVGG